MLSIYYGLNLHLMIAMIKLVAIKKLLNISYSIVEFKDIYCFRLFNFYTVKWY